MKFIPIILYGLLMMGMSAQGSEYTQKLYRKALQEDVPSMRKLGVALHKGQGVKRDVKNAIRWLQKAAEKKDAAALYYLGGMYHRGNGVSKDEKSAANYLLKSYELGFSKAEELLADLPLEHTVDWYRTKARKGDIDSLFKLADAYASGNGLEKDLHSAERCYRDAYDRDPGKTMQHLSEVPLSDCLFFWEWLALEKKDEGALMRLADAYGNGNGIPEDPKKAARYYALAAEKGNQEAKRIIKSMPLDQALEWWEKHADEGEIEAILRLAEAYDQGNGVERNPRKAAAYYEKAADQGEPTAEAWLRQNVPGYKTPEERRAERERERKEREARAEEERIRRAIEHAENIKKLRMLLLAALDYSNLPETNRFLTVHAGSVQEKNISRSEIAEDVDVASLILSIPVFQKVAKDGFLCKTSNLGIIAVRVPSAEALDFSDGSKLSGYLIREGDYTYTRRDQTTVTVPQYVLLVVSNY